VVVWRDPGRDRELKAKSGSPEGLKLRFSFDFSASGFEIGFRIRFSESVFQLRIRNRNSLKTTGSASASGTADFNRFHLTDRSNRGESLGALLKVVDVRARASAAGVLAAEAAGLARQTGA